MIVVNSAVGSVAYMRFLQGSDSSCVRGVNTAGGAVSVRRPGLRWYGEPYPGVAVRCVHGAEEADQQRGREAARRARARRRPRSRGRRGALARGARLGAAARDAEGRLEVEDAPPVAAGAAPPYLLALHAHRDRTHVALSAPRQLQHRTAAAVAEDRVGG